MNIHPVYNLPKLNTVRLLDREKIMESSKTLADKVYDHLKVEILSGNLEPGAPLREEVVAKRFK
ncbi:MAG: GntR family transcriptional regulator, partial [Anaerolineales bacterium]|nr:GntR family transcriptional regulator [Anaerolineales bacterium]